MAWIWLILAFVILKKKGGSERVWSIDFTLFFQSNFKIFFQISIIISVKFEHFWFYCFFSQIWRFLLNYLLLLQSNLKIFGEISIVFSVRCAVLSDLSTFLKVPLNALKTFIWPLLVSFRLHFAFKVRGKWKYAVLSDFSEFFRVSINSLKAFIFVWSYDLNY